MISLMIRSPKCSRSFVTMAAMSFAVLFAQSPTARGQEPEVPAAEVEPEVAVENTVENTVENAVENAETQEVPVAEATPETPADKQPVADEQNSEIAIPPSPVADLTDSLADLEGASSDVDNPGRDDLDRAMEIKIMAGSLKDLNQVVNLIDLAMEEGLDAENTDFAEQVLVSTLLQRANSLSQAVLSQGRPDPRKTQQIFQIRLLALTDLLRAVSLDPQQYEAWLLLGQLQSLPGGNKSEARRAFGKVIRHAEETADDPAVDKIDPKKLAQAYALRGASQQKSELRLADFGKAIAMQPERAEYYVLRAKLHQAEKRPEACLTDLNQALELAPENASIHELKALALFMQEKPEAALESFNRASELAPEAVSPYQYRGEVFSKLGRLDEAVAQLDRAIELAPTNLASRLVRAELLLALAASIEEPTTPDVELQDSPEDSKPADQDKPIEQPEENLAEIEQLRVKATGYRERALTDIDQALAVQPVLVRGHLMRARVLDALGRVEEAIATLEHLVQAAPDNAELHFRLAAYYVDVKLHAEAVEALSRVLELDPGNVLALRLRGDMRLTLGEHAGAIHDFTEAMEKNPLDTGALNNFAWTLATSPYDEVRDGKRAVELATKACEETDFVQPHILSTLAASHAEAGDFEKAIHWAEEAVSKATELGILSNYDGQLEAELDSYRDGKPWRELQRAEGTEAGPEGKVPSNPGPTNPAPAEAPQPETPINEENLPAEPRSLDF